MKITLKSRKQVHTSHFSESGDKVFSYEFSLKEITSYVKYL